jgi:hypothetical protein
MTALVLQTEEENAAFTHFSVGINRKEGRVTPLFLFDYHGSSQ